MNPLVSVVIPAYNIERLIKETMDSVLLQTYSNLELIVVDDGSTDRTRDIVNSIRDGRVRYHYQPNSGLPAKARNKGVKLSRGEYIAVLDHDDIWMPEKLEEQMAVIKNDKSIGLIATNAFYMYGSEKTEKPLIRNTRSGYFNERIFVPNNKVIQSTIIMRRDSFDAIGGFNESEDFKAIEDYDLWLRMYSKCRCYYIEKPTAYYRLNAGSASGNELQVLGRSLRHYNKYFAQYGMSENTNDARLFEILHALALRHFLSGNKEWKKYFQDIPLSRIGPLRLMRCLIFMLPHRIASRIYNSIKYGRKTG